MLHGLDVVAIRLRGNLAVLEINLHPLVGGLLQLRLQDFPAQQLAIFRLDGGNTRESLVFEQMLEADRLEMTLDVRDALIGMLQPHAVFGPHGNVANARLAAAAGRASELRVLAAHLDVHQPAIADIVVVGRGEALDDAGLDPLPTPAGFPHAKGGDDAAQRRLARVPAAGRHRRKHRAITVGLSLHIEHATGLGRDDALVAFHPSERPFLSEARDGAVDEPREALRQRVVIQSPVSRVARAERLHEHISRPDELEGLSTAFRRVEIQHDALLPRFHEIQAG
jgi:hypothetical protein